MSAEIWRAVAVKLYRALKVAVGGTGDGWQTGQGADASAKINAALQLHRDALKVEGLCAEMFPGPMDSAPRDGTRILVFHKCHFAPRWVIASWDKDEHHKNPRPYFRIAGAYGVRDSRDAELVAWLPLPPAPKVTR
jgi:hypothetical protein